MLCKAYKTVNVIEVTLHSKGFNSIWILLKQQKSYFEGRPKQSLKPKSIVTPLFRLIKITNILKLLKATGEITQIICPCHTTILNWILLRILKILLKISAPLFHYIKFTWLAYVCECKLSFWGGTTILFNK